MGVFDFVTEVLDAPSRWGTNLANKNLSDESIALAKRYGELKDNEKGDNLGSCALKQAGRAVTDQIPECKPDAGEMGKDAAGRVASKVAEKAIGSTVMMGVGVLKDMGMSAAEAVQNHHDMVELMAKNGVPGFAYKEVDMAPGTYKVWVDASAEALKKDGHPTVDYDTKFPAGTDPQDTHSVYGPDRAKQEAAKLAATNEALGSMHDYIAQNGVDGYKARLADEADNKLPGYIQQQKAPATTPAPAPEAAPAAAPAPAAAASAPVAMTAIQEYEALMKRVSDPKPVAAPAMAMS